MREASSMFTIIAVLLMPAAVGVAMMKYRLYDLDLVFNRTLVYGPLTAVMAGVFAATIGLTQKIFVAATGQKSDAAVVFTTLVIVALSTPAKNVIQGVVDRTFKHVPDPRRELLAFAGHVSAIAEVVDPDCLLRTFMAQAVTAFDAAGGEVRVRDNGRQAVPYSEGRCEGPGATSISIANSNGEIGVLILGPRRDGRRYNNEDTEALALAAESVARAYTAVARR
jgi:hypothetical protein